MCLWSILLKRHGLRANNAFFSTALLRVIAVPIEGKNIHQLPWHPHLRQRVRLISDMNGLPIFNERSSPRPRSKSQGAALARRGSPPRKASLPHPRRNAPRALTRRRAKLGRILWLECVRVILPGEAFMLRATTAFLNIAVAVLDAVKLIGEVPGGKVKPLRNKLSHRLGDHKPRCLNYVLPIAFTVYDIC